MEQSTPEGHPEDALRRLEARLERASDAAERLFSEAASEATSAAIRMSERLSGRTASTRGPQARPRAEGPPAQGWQIPGHDEEPRPERGEIELLVAAWESVRELVPPELRRRLSEAIKEMLLAVRALIDWYVERLEHRAAQPVQVQDIPVL